MNTGSSMIMNDSGTYIGRASVHIVIVAFCLVDLYPILLGLFVRKSSAKSASVVAGSVVVSIHRCKGGVRVRGRMGLLKSPTFSRMDDRCFQLVHYVIEYLKSTDKMVLWVGVPLTLDGLKSEEFLERKFSKFVLRSWAQCSVKAIAATLITRSILILSCSCVERNCLTSA